MQAEQQRMATSPPREYVPENRRGAQAQATAAARLGHLNVVVLDSDITAAQLIRKALSTLGITQTYLTKDSREAVDIIKQRQIDLLITEWDSRPDSGLDVTRYLRSTDSPNRMLPIIMLTSRTGPEDMNLARNTGVNEYVMKPFSVRVMMERITGIVDFPKSFIVARGYVGPDRRDGTPPPPGIAERRGNGGKGEEPLVISKDLVGEIFIDDKPRMIMPDYSLKHKIEAAANRMGGLENILSPAEAAKRLEDYLQWMLTDIHNIHAAYKTMLAQPEQMRSCLERILSATLSLRTRAMSSGYVLAARIAVALNEFCQKYFDPNNANHYTVISKHIDTLRAILAHRISGDDNPLGRELVGELRVLVKKYI